MAEIDLRPDVVTVAATRADGGLTVSRFVTQEYRAPTTEDIAAGITTKVPNGRPKEITPEVVNKSYERREGNAAVVSWEFVPNDYLGEDTDRTFRTAWVHARGRKKPDHDIAKAREIVRVHLRTVRLAEFCRLDTQYAQADEAGDQDAKKEIGALRQKFRDVTEDPRIDAAQTVDELKELLNLKVLVPETVGRSYMKEKMRVNPAIPGVVEREKGKK